MSLEGKTVILFGAGAIASGYAQSFVDEKANVVFVSRGDSSEKLASELQSQVAEKDISRIDSMHADASNFNEVSGIFDQTVEKFGRVDAIVNGSGGNTPEALVTDLDSFIGMDPSVPEAMFANNYLSKHLALQHFARVLKDADYQGSAVNITSMAGLQPLSKVMDYSAAYAAVESLTKSVAHLYAAIDIGRVNNVAVGFLIGEQNRALLENEDGSPTARGGEIKTGISQGKFLSPEDIAPPCAHACRSRKKWVN